MNHWSAYPGDVGDTSRQVAYTHWQNGELTQLSLTPFNPKNYASAGTSDAADFTPDDMVNVIVPGNALNTDLNDQLNIIIGHSKWLQDRGVPVLVMPYYLMTQGGHW